MFPQLFQSKSSQQQTQQQKIPTTQAQTQQTRSLFGVHTSTHNVNSTPYSHVGPSTSNAYNSYNNVGPGAQQQTSSRSPYATYPAASSVYAYPLVEFTHVWPVALKALDFGSFKEVIASPDWSTTYKSISYKWQLLLYPTESVTQPKENTIGYYLTFRDGPLEYLTVDVELYILSKNFERIAKNSARGVELELNGRAWGFAQFCLQDIYHLEDQYATDLIEDHEMKFGITLRMKPTTFNSKNFFPSTIGPAKPEQLSAYLYDRVVLEPESGGERADCRLVSMDGAGFYCNRAVLEFASPVFQALLARHLPFVGQEAMAMHKNDINVDDLSSAALRELLHFVYKGVPSQHLPALAAEVVHGADKYQLWELKTLCEKEMVFQLSEKNAVKYLYISECYGLHTLKNMSLNVTYDRWPVIRNTKAGDKLLEDKRIMQKLMDVGSQRCNCHVNYISWDRKT